MGDPKKRRKKYATPLHPWNRERIDEERILVKEYGLRNKKEIWKLESLLRNFKSQAKRLISLTSKQAEVEKDQLLSKLSSLGLIGKGAPVEDILAVELKDVLDRRLQTIVFKKKFSKTIIQARQFITHRHVSIGDKVLSFPSYIVKIDEEASVNFRPTSSLFNQDHPERIIQESKPKKEEKKKPRKQERPKKDSKKAAAPKKEKTKSKGKKE
ncbi:MAG: 30S ribosomal protein S4 [Nanoarchaeota archaeon]